MNAPRYRVCSGQSRRRAFGHGSANDWGICLNDYEACPWWRYQDARGRIRTFPTYEAAERARAKLESGPVPADLAAALEERRRRRADDPAAVRPVRRAGYGLQAGHACFGCHLEARL